MTKGPFIRQFIGQDVESQTEFLATGYTYHHSL
jgi:hypothetical protein